MSTMYQHDWNEEEKEPTFSDVGLQDLYERYITEVVEGDYRKSSADSKLSHLRTWLKWCRSEDIEPTGFEEKDAYKYFGSRKSEVSDSTLSSSYSTVNSFFEWGTTVELCDSNPVDEFTLSEQFEKYSPSYSERQRALDQQTEPEEQTVIDRQTVNKIIETPGSPAVRNELLFRLLYQTGCRASEIANITLDNVSLEERKIYLKTAKADETHPFQYRYVYYEDNLDFLMQRWSDAEVGERNVYGTSSDSDYLFLTRKSPQMRAGYISRLVREAAERAGVQRVLNTRPSDLPNTEVVEQHQIAAHEFRRARITELANRQGMPLHHVQAIAGHAKLEQTREYVDDSDWPAVEASYRDAVGD